MRGAIVMELGLDLEPRKEEKGAISVAISGTVAMKAHMDTILEHLLDYERQMQALHREDDHDTVLN